MGRFQPVTNLSRTIPASADVHFAVLHALAETSWQGGWPVEIDTIVVEPGELHLHMRRSPVHPEPSPP